MFPSRMGRVVLDRVENPAEYWTGRQVELLIDTEKTLSGFYYECAANPHCCALAKNVKSADDIQSDVENLFKNLMKSKLTLYSSEDSPTIGFLMRKIVFELLYFPARWSQLSTILDAAIEGDLMPLMDSSKVSVRNVYPSPAGPEANFGIRCGDADFRTEDVSETTKIGNDLQSLSPTFREVAVKASTACWTWKLQAKERSPLGSEAIKTAHPLLFVGNSYDPVTPFVFAKNASASFAASALLKSDTYGHTSLAQPSLRTAKAIQAYFVDGTLPPHGTVCPHTVPAFHKKKDEEEFYFAFE